MPAAAERPIRLVAGLGNPGREYENTRHNAGFLVIDRLAARLGLTLQFSQAWQTLFGRAADGCMYLKPMTFMNLSGRAVQSVAQFYKVDATETLIVYDDLALPLGQLRLRREGSAGGQNGMQSVIEHLGTAAVPRVPGGIGAAAEGGQVGPGRGKFTVDELSALTAAIDRAADAVVHSREHGLEAAMNLFNRAAPESATPHLTTRQPTERTRSS